MKTETLNQFLEREKRRYKIEKEVAARLVQEAVGAALRIKAQIDEIAETVKCGKFPREEGKKLIHRRLRALERIRQVQARAFKKAYGVDAPTIEEIG